jgi:hypothetical protein
MAKILPDAWALPDALRARVGASPGRQRAMLHDGHALLLLHQPPKAGERERRPTVLWRSPDGDWRSTPGPSGPSALKGVIDAYAARVDEIDARLARARSARDRFAVMRDARPLARAARNVHAALQEVRTAIPADADVLAQRDRAYDLERDATALLEECHAAMQLGLAEGAEEQAEVSRRIARETHRLNLLAAVCLPITALGAMLGMNLETGLEHLAGPPLFAGVVAAAFATGLLLHAWVRSTPSEAREPTAQRPTLAMRVEVPRA